jgi:hypothetical protein
LRLGDCADILARRISTENLEVPRHGSSGFFTTEDLARQSRNQRSMATKNTRSHKKGSFANTCHGFRSGERRQFVFVSFCVFSGKRGHISTFDISRDHESRLPQLPKATHHFSAPLRLCAKTGCFSCPFLPQKISVPEPHRRRASFLSVGRRRHPWANPFSSSHPVRFSAPLASRRAAQRKLLCALCEKWIGIGTVG